MKRFEPHAEPDLSPDDVLFVDASGSRNKQSLFALAFISLLCTPLVLAEGARSWIVLPWWVVFGGLWFWCVFCIATNQHWKVTVTRKRVTWDRLFSSTPLFVHVEEIDNIWLRDDDPGRHLVIVLKDGKSVTISSAIVSWIDAERLIAAIQEAMREAKERPGTYLAGN